MTRIIFRTFLLIVLALVAAAAFGQTTWPAAHDTFDPSLPITGYWQTQTSYDEGLTWDNDRDSWPVEIRAERRNLLLSLQSADWSMIDEERWAAPVETWMVREEVNDYCECVVGVYHKRFIFVPLQRQGNRRG